MSRKKLFVSAVLGFSFAASRAQEAVPQPAAVAPLPAPAAWTWHAQTTYNIQGYGAFTAPYAGNNSLEDHKQIRGSFTATAFLGRRLWRGAELYFNPELIGGQGVSRVVGLAGPPNGETYRVDSTELKITLARLFLRQTFDFDGEQEVMTDDLNQLAGAHSRHRLVITTGKYSGSDIFDANTYAHDPRSQFNNWSLWENAAWDYPADTRGYSYGVTAELYLNDWAFRLGSFMEPKQANGILLDHDVRRAHGDSLEIEHDYTLGDQPGKARLLAFLNHAQMGDYKEALRQSPAAPDVTATRRPGTRKYGLGLNLEQAITPEIGVFMRAGWNDGKTESWAFTEVERTLTVGVSSSGKLWGRPHDRIAAAMAWNGINGDHRAYLAAGGNGFMLGDGRLNYSPEHLMAVYYLWQFWRHGALSVEAQHYENPAFNADRGPVTVFGSRLHIQF